jgi:hypothetical protein
MLCCKKEVVLGNCELKLESLKNSATLSGDFAILPAEGPDTCFKGAKINVTLLLRTPCVGHEFTTVSKLTFMITKTFPSFKSIAESKSAEVKKEEPKTKEVKPIQKPQAGDNIKPEAKAKPKPVDFSAEEFKPEELEDPDWIENLVSLKVLEMKMKEVEAQIAKIDGRAPPKIREKFLKMRVKHKVSLYVT